MKFLKKIKNWRYWHLFVLSIIFLAGTFLRFYRLEQNIWLTNDSGRDTLVAKHLIEYEHNFFIRPAVGGSIFLKNSPLYYWLLASFWFLTNSPLGIAFFFALLGSLSIILVYSITSFLLNSRAGLFSAILTAFSFQLVRYSKSIYQPFILPFFFALTLFFLVYSIKKAHFGSLLLAVFVFFISLLIHYSILPLVPIFLFWFVFSLLSITRKKKDSTLFYLLFFSILFISLTLFCFFLTGQSFSMEKITSLILLDKENLFRQLSLKKFLSNLYHNLYLVFSFSLKSEKELTRFVFIITQATVGGLGLSLLIDLKRDEYRKTLIPFSFLFSIFFSGFYTQTVYDYYFAPFYIILPIVWGFLIETLFARKKLFAKTLSFLFLIILLFISSKNNVDYFNEISLSFLAQNQFTAKAIVTDFKNIDQPVLGAYLANNHTAINSLITEKNPYIYTITRNGDQWSWDAPSVWYFLEKELEKPLVKLVNDHNNIIPLNRPPEYLYLICLRFETEQKAETDCLDYFISREKTWEKEHKITGLSNLNLNFITYRLRSKNSN